jgi:DMSO reductase family type II enzyme heme b subunit
MCHGEEGDGLGPAAERFSPPPRDFTLGQYKIKTTYFDDMIANDEDVYRMIAEGMPGTVMPGWSDVLSEQDIWDLIAYLKVFGGFEEEVPSQQVDYGVQVAISEESIAEGKKLFLEDDRCSECHGKDGKGDASKKLKDDNSARTWPRNLTKPWTFRGSADPKDIFSRITVGIPGTQMPSLADPKNKKKLSIEERWHVANYVSTLAKTEEVVRPENTVVIAEKVEDSLPTSADDPRWAEVTPSTFYLLPQLIGEERFFTPSNDTITARAIYDSERIAFLVSWDDRTKSVPGDEAAEKISDPNLASDAVSIQLPVSIPEGTEKPYFAMGDSAHPVNLYQWKSGTVDTAESVSMSTGRGFGEITQNDAGTAGVTASGVYSNGTWQVLFTRPLASALPGEEIGIEEGKFIPLAFAAWDGSNSEVGSKHTITTWYWLLLKPETGSKPLFVAFIIFGLIAGAELLWLRTTTGRRKENDA